MNARLKRIVSVVRKEIRHILRDRQTLLIIMFMPVGMMFLYGYALTLDVKDARVLVEAPAPDRAARQLIAGVEASSLFAVIDVVPAVTQATKAFKQNDAKLILRIPAGFVQKLQTAGKVNVGAVIDGTDPNTATIIRNAVSVLVQDAVMNYLSRDIPAAVHLKPCYLYNPEQESALFFVPGLMAIILIMVSALLTSLTITREKERGTMEQLLISPLGSTEIIIGKIVPYVALAFFEAVIILAMGAVFFGVTVQGSLLLLAGATLLYIVTALALGLIFSTVAATQQQAMLMVLPATLLPTIVLSGFIFPIRSMPIFLQWVARAIPATYYLTVIRGIVLKGVGPAALWQPLAALTGLGVLFLTVSMVLFRRQQ